MCVVMDLTKSLLKKIPTRYCIACVILLNSLYFIIIRATMSINLVAMVPVSTNTTSDSSTGLNWTAYERGIVLSSYYWGCLAGNFIVGPMLEVVSVRKGICTCLLLLGILNLLAPLAAQQGVQYMILIRVCLGLLSGVSNPGNNTLISKWATPHEKGMFIGVLVLSSSGTFFAWSIGGYIVNTWGWEWGFYAFGIAGPFIACLCWFIMYDTPEEHPRILPEEILYLQKQIKRNRGTKPNPPFRKIYTSAPVWSNVILNFGFGWGVNFLITSAPNYIANTLGFSITSTGLMSAFIYLFRSVIGFIAGTISDILLKKGIIRVGVLRRAGIIFSHLLPGCGLLFMLKMGFPTLSYVIIIGVSMAFNGLVILTSSVNTHDLTTNYVSSVAALAFAAVNAAGIVTPIVTAHLTKADETNVEQWRSVFLVGASVYLLSGLQFYLFGSTEKQPWDQTETSEVKKNDMVE